MPMDCNLQTGCVKSSNYRISVLTDRLICLEYCEDGSFEDRPTQAVVSRAFPPVSFRLWRTERGIELHTQYLTVFYDEKPFSASGLRIENHSACAGIYCTWRYGDQQQENLGGTARTLDEADGAVLLEDGLFSRLQGYAVVDDSRSLVFREDGRLERRAECVRDLYFFAYGYAYKEELRDYFRLCGKTPLLPRFALGNWWSRYHAYTAESYLALMDRFAENRIPLSVSVIDMDWHVTKPADGGKGWTGYTWNTELFPEPERFLEELHRRGLKNTLNLHPAEGVQAHEAAYPEMAAALHKNAEDGQRIPFDPVNPEFMEAYFRILHHPLEEMGVDFWWVDWQQGTACDGDGPDPLWILNHAHFLDNARGGKRPLILSRYAGIGSHRYPVGFSGDSVISWNSLRFQPYFTATASNIGFGWWSHDIGGHAKGSRDDDLQLRWLQFGVFSPILRLHSSSGAFNSKEPWMYDGAVQEIMKRFLQLRHRLIPYLYSMNYLCHTQDEMLVQPLYYAYPEQPEAYTHPNQYYFGDSLLVCPITKPLCGELRMGNAAVWLPEGVYFDFFTGVKYGGNCEIRMYRTLESIPVLTKAGAILPMTDAAEAMQNGAALPGALEIRVYGGADGKLQMYEDDGETQACQTGDFALTEAMFVWQEGDASRFSLHSASQKPWLPARRDVTVSLFGVTRNEAITVTMNRAELTDLSVTYDERMHRLSVSIKDVPCNSDIEIHFLNGLALAENDVMGRCYEILNRAQSAYELKDRIYGMLKAGLEQRALIASLSSCGLSSELLEALLEMILA